MINVCVPVLKRYDLLRELLQSLEQSTDTPDAVYIIDNGRDFRRCREAINDIDLLITVHRPTRVMGVAESWNWFIQNVPEDRLITNDDILFAPHSLAEMQKQKALFVSCTFGFSCFIIRDALVGKVGLFDETISPGYAYFEVMDYLRRVRLAEIPDDVVECGVVHHQSSTPASFTQDEMLDHNVRFAVAQENYRKKWESDPSWDDLKRIGGAGANNG